MSHLLDVNLLAACAWQSHARHREANRWLQSLTRFATCPVGQRLITQADLPTTSTVVFDRADYSFWVYVMPPFVRS